MKKSSISAKIDLGPVITRSNVDIGKHTKRIASTRREQSTGRFSRSATTLSFETPGGSHRPRSPLPGRVMENALPGRGLSVVSGQLVTSLYSQDAALARAVQTIDYSVLSDIVLTSEPISTTQDTVKFAQYVNCSCNK